MMDRKDKRNKNFRESPLFDSLSPFMIKDMVAYVCELQSSAQN